MMIPPISAVCRPIIVVQQDSASPIDLSAIDISDVDAAGGDLSVRLSASIDGVATAAAGSGITITNKWYSGCHVEGSETDHEQLLR